MQHTPKHILYRIISFLLLPFAAFLSLFAISLLFIALANSPMLLPWFVTMCIILYTFTSFNFLIKGIGKNRPCKPSLKDWIKVNAYVTIFFCVWSIFQSAAAIAQPQLYTKAVEEFMTTQPQNPQVTKEMILRMAAIVPWLILGYAVVLLVHIIITFRLLKRYRYLFEPLPQDPE